MKNTKYFTLGLCAILAMAGCTRRGGGNNTSSSSEESSIPDVVPSTNSEGNFVFENVKITYGNPITGADGAHMRKLVSDFNKEYQGQIPLPPHNIQGSPFRKP